MSQRALFLSLELLVALLASALTASSADLAPQIELVLKTHFDAGEFNGTALVARSGRAVLERGFGFANLEWKTPNDVDTKFEIGSMTKQFTALLILQFVNERKISLEGHLSDYLSYYRSDTGSQVTVHQLLSHTSGIPEFLTPAFMEDAASRRRYNVRDFVLKHCSGDSQFRPGTRFAYSNSGYFLLGAILEAVSGETYEQLLAQRIFVPLGMRESGYTSTGTVLPKRASGYERTPAGLQNARYYDMSIPFAAGALYSTAHDLFLWDRALYTERFLPAKLRDLLFKPKLEDYGYGWAILTPSVGSPYAGESIPMHGGAIFGFQSVIVRIPGHAELIVLLNNKDSPKLLQIALEIRRVLSANP